MLGTSKEKAGILTVKIPPKNFKEDCGNKGEVESDGGCKEESGEAFRIW